MNMRPSLCLALLSAVSLNIGCDDTLKRVSLIEETRVLGARAEVDGDPLRSSPEPGERATVRFFVAAPDGPASVDYALSACAVKPTFNGIPQCSGLPFASTQRTESSTEPVAIELEVPIATDLDATPHALIRGTIARTEVAFELDLGSATSNNQSPTFTADALELDAEPWRSVAEPSCDGVPSVAARSRHRFGVTLGDGDFEPLVQATSVDPSRETLLVSQFADAGELEHAYLSLTAATPASEREVTWTAPALTDSEPRLVRFYFVVRDERGGEDLTTRALCVLP